MTGDIHPLCGHGEEDPLFLGMDYHWSPTLDGFVVTEGGGIPRIRLVQLNDRNDCREQALPTPANFHAWSPGGKAFLFSHWEWELGQGDPAPLIAQAPRLYVWDVPQGNVKWTGPTGGYGGAWSPDGRHLAFFLLGNPRYEDSRLIGSDFVPGLPFPLHLVVLDTRTEELLTLISLEEEMRLDGYYDARRWFEQRKPVWSPDGRQLVYWGSRDELWVIRLDETDRQKLIGNGDIIDVAWSPNGDKLAVASLGRLWILAR
jgi:Tol biopolymer transport system component